MNTLSRQYLYNGANIFGNNPLLGRDFKKTVIETEFFFLLLFIFNTKSHSHLYKKKASALAPGKTLGAGIKIKWDFYIISVCI